MLVMVLKKRGLISSERLAQRFFNAYLHTFLHGKREETFREIENLLSCLRGDPMACTLEESICRSGMMDLVHNTLFVRR